MLAKLQRFLKNYRKYRFKTTLRRYLLFINNRCTNYIKNTLEDIERWLSIPFKRYQIKRIIESYNIEKLIDYCITNPKNFIELTQIKSELLNLLLILKKNKPKNILEIGTYGGGTLLLLSQIASKDALIISIDLPEGKFGGGYPKWKASIYKSFATNNQKIRLIRADSHDPKSLEKVKKFLKGNKLDFLFLDGDHTYQGVKKDFKNYSLLVKKNGIIGFHDILFHPQ